MRLLHLLKYKLILYSILSNIRNYSQVLRMLNELKYRLFIFNDMNKDKLMEHKAVTIAHKPLIVYIITVLMISTSIIYFYVSYQDYEELLQMSSSTDSQNVSEMLATRNEMTFFLIVAIAYIPIALWMLKVKHNNKIPYIIAVVGSVALIIFYILTRTIDLPSIGLQTDVGVIDIIAKVLQGAIISVSIFLIISTIIRNQLDKKNPATR
ncbi:MAG TPA: hypothetical protein VN704_02355 [Verrucomicrobiae bacterium]|nr:hypothetical protein [Verrucomicrobiae bacterium]